MGASPATAISPGTFRLYKGGHDLSGTFASPQAGVNGYPFPAAVRVAPLDADRRSKCGTPARASHGGAARFAYSIKPLGEPTPPTRASMPRCRAPIWRRSRTARSSTGVRFGGAATGHVLLEWPLGRFVEHTGQGTFAVTPPPASR